MYMCILLGLQIDCAHCETNCFTSCAAYRWKGFHRPTKLERLHALALRCTREGLTATLHVTTQGNCCVALNIPALCQRVEVSRLLLSSRADINLANLDGFVIHLTYFYGWSQQIRKQSNGATHAHRRNNRHGCVRTVYLQLANRINELCDWT